MNPIKAIGHALLAVLVVSIGPHAPAHGQTCSSCGQSCALTAAPQCNSCTVLVPRTVIEYRPMIVARCRQETRQRMITVYRDVPTTKVVQEQYTAMVPEVRTRTVEDVMYRPVPRDIELRITDMAPVIESRQATCTVSRMEPVQEEKIVYETVAREAATAPSSLIRTVSYQQETPVNALPSATNLREAPPTNETPSAAPPPAAPVASGRAARRRHLQFVRPTGMQRVRHMSPVLVPRKVCVPCTRPVCQQRTIEYPVTHFEPRVRSETVSFYEYQTEKVPREEQYTVYVPQQKTCTRDITVMKTVAEERPQLYTVSVPYDVEVQVPVPVVRWVPQPAASSCGICDGP